MPKTGWPKPYPYTTLGPGCVPRTKDNFKLAVGDLVECLPDKDMDYPHQHGKMGIIKNFAGPEILKLVIFREFLLVAWPRRSLKIVKPREELEHEQYAAVRYAGWVEPCDQVGWGEDE